MLEFNKLMEDGKVHVKMEESETMEELLEKANIEYYCFEVDNNTMLFELAIEEEED